jgi:hypothetical protein
MTPSRACPCPPKKSPLAFARRRNEDEEKDGYEQISLFDEEDGEKGLVNEAPSLIDAKISEEKPAKRRVLLPLRRPESDGDG